MPRHELLVAELHRFERLLGEAFAAGGALQATAVAAQRERGYSSIVGHQVLAAISAANLSVSGAITSTADGHRRLEAIGKALGLDVIAYGDGVKPQIAPTGHLAASTPAAQDA